MITDKTQFNKKQVKYWGKFQTDENLIQFANLLRQKMQKDALLKIQFGSNKECMKEVQ